MWILFTGEILRALIFKSSYVFLKRPLVSYNLLVLACHYLRVLFGRVVEVFECAPPTCIEEAFSSTRLILDNLHVEIFFNIDEVAGYHQLMIESVNLGAFKSSRFNKLHTFQCTRKMICVEFQREPLKFHTNISHPYIERYDPYTCQKFSLRFTSLYAFLKRPSYGENPQLTWIM